MNLIIEAKSGMRVTQEAEEGPWGVMEDGAEDEGAWGMMEDGAEDEGKEDVLALLGVMMMQCSIGGRE